MHEEFSLKNASSVKTFSADTRLSSIKPATSKAVKHLVALPNRFRKFREWERELPAGPPHGCRPGPHATKFNGQSSKTKPHKMFLVGPKVEIVTIDHFTCTPFFIQPRMDQDERLATLCGHVHVDESCLQTFVDSSRTQTGKRVRKQWNVWRQKAQINVEEHSRRNVPSVLPDRKKSL